MEFMQKVTQRLQGLRRFGRVLKEEGLINTTDLLVATGATVVLASGVGSAVIGTASEAKYGKAQPDAQALSTAISQFYTDTGKWPGQAEHAPADGVSSVPPKFLVTSTALGALPDDLAAMTTVGETECANSSLEGFAGVTIQGGNAGTDAVGGVAANPAGNLLNINDYLVTNPGAGYQNWKGPYLTGGAIETDPWNRTWVLNVQAMYCAETLENDLTTGVAVPSTLGNAWILSAGNNRTLTTAVTEGGLDKEGDDAGSNMGKFVAKLVVEAD